MTICSAEHRCIFREPVGPTVCPLDISNRSQALPPLSRIGSLVENAIVEIPALHPQILVDKFVVMPNHLHLLLAIQLGESGRSVIAPTISTVVRGLKTFVSRKAGFPVWQCSFHHHIVRNQRDYEDIWRYIDENPLKWELDRYDSLSLNEIDRRHK